MLSMLTSFILADVFITEIADPNNEVGARFVEVYNNGDTEVDLSQGWSLQRWTNGNVDPQTPIALTGTIPAGGFYIVSCNSTTFETTYGFAPNQDVGTGGVADSNGDDNIALLDATGTISDLFGVPGEDGTGTGHEFEDGRAERVATVNTPNPVWNATEWNIDNDSGLGEGPQDAPEGFDPGFWVGAEVVDNYAPTANAGDDFEAMVDEITGDVSVTLDGSGSNDIDGDVLTYSWLLDGVEVSTDATFYHTLTVGVYTFSLTVSDGELTDSDDVIVTVIAYAEPMTIILSEDFELGEGDFTSYSVASNKDWYHDSYSGNHFMKISGYGGDEYSNDWLYTPAMNFDLYTNETLSFGTMANYSGPALEVKISTDFVGGDPTVATWTDLTGFALSDGGYAYVESGNIDVSGFNGSAVTVAFRYITDETGSALYEVDDVLVQGYEAETPTNIFVTFQVNMMYVDPADGVYVRGGNIGSSMPDVPSMGWLMSDDDADLIYEVVIELEPNTHYTYKFATGESWNWEGNWESVPAECGEGTYLDRFMDTGAEDMVLSPVCFGSCDDCASSSNVTFQVDVSGLDLENYVDNNGEPFYGVYATGSFDGWAGWGLQLTDEDADGVYVGTAEIPEGTYEYLFTINGWNGLTGNAPLGSECDWNPNDEFANYGMDVGPEDIVLDVVCWASCVPCIDFVTIYDIQGQAEATPFAGQVIETTGVVTATGGSKHFIQDGSGAWNGIYIYDGDNTYTVGDHINIVAEATEYYGLTELINVSSIVVNSSENPLPESVVLTTAEVNTEDYEGVLVTTVGACDNEANNYGEWSLNDGSGTAWTDDIFFAFVPVLGAEYGVTGPLTYSYENYKILPRDESDVVEIAEVPEFTFTFNVTGANAGHDLTVGFSRDATDGYDAGIDSYAPPAPPPPSFDVALGWEGDRYFTQILNGAEADWDVEHTYEVLLQYDESNAVTFTWDNTGLNDLGTFTLEDAFGGMMINVVMNTETSITIDDPAFTVLKLRVTPGEFIEPVPVPNFMCTVNLAGANDEHDLTVGFSPDATDGYDVGVDAYAPPAPPPPAFDVALGWDNDRYYTQILNGAEADWEVEHVYDIQLQYDESGTIVLSWDNALWSYYGNVILRDGFDGAIFYDVDMVAVNEFVLDNPAITVVKLVVKPGEYVPIPPPPPPAPENLTATEGEGYIELNWDPVDLGSTDGFDFEFPVTFNGGGETSYTLITGFSPNATDAYDEGVDLYAPPAPPPPSFDAALGWLSDRYYTQILNGADGVVEEHVYDIQLQFDTNSIINISWDNTGLAELGTFVLQDAFGGAMINIDMTQQNTFIVDNTAFNLLKLFITPTLNEPVYNFNVYRDGVLFVSGLTEPTYTDTDVLIQEYCYTVTQIMPDGNETEHSNVACATPIEVAIDNETMPGSFALHQNYPNPFNPLTTIVYDVAEEALVNVSIYNLMGQKVRTLVTVKQTQGRYFVQWDARNDLGETLPTGVYIYRIEAGNFTDVKKLVLMK